MIERRRAVRVAVVLWIVLAIVVWNVAFDRIIVEAGRAYVRAARASAEGGTYLHAGDWMRSATVHGVWMATALSLVILVPGLVAIGVVWRRERRNSEF